MAAILVWLVQSSCQVNQSLLVVPCTYILSFIKIGTPQHKNQNYPNLPIYQMAAILVWSAQSAPKVDQNILLTP